MNPEASLLVSKRLQAHRAYTPGIQPQSGDSVIKLNTNENPYPPSPTVEDAVSNEISLLNLYPNPSSMSLRKKIAEMHGLDANQIIIGNGSDDLLNLSVRSFADDKLKVGMLDPSYSLYEVLVGIQGANLVKLPFKDDQFSFDPQEISSSATNLFFLPNLFFNYMFSMKYCRKSFLWTRQAFLMFGKNHSRKVEWHQKKEEECGENTF